MNISSLPLLLSFSLCSFGASAGVYFESALKPYFEDESDANEAAPLILGKFWVSRDRAKVEFFAADKFLWRAQFSKKDGVFFLESRKGQKVDVSQAEQNAEALLEKNAALIKVDPSEIAYPDEFKAIPNLRFNRLEGGVTFDTWKDAEKYKGFEADGDETRAEVWTVSHRELGLQRSEVETLQTVVPILLKSSRELEVLFRFTGRDWVARMQYPGIPVKALIYDPDDDEEPILEARVSALKWRSFAPNVFARSSSQKK